MGMHTKIVFLWQCLKGYSILRNNNSQLAVMVAILNKNFSDFAWGYGVGFQTTFLKNSSGYIFPMLDWVFS